jgi:hypothetical protein
MTRLAFAALLAGAALPASAAEIYQFLATPHTSLNRIYRIDTTTGEMGACQYGLKDNTVGVTLCYPPGEGAGPQTPSDYGLVASNHQQEAGVFRINKRTGEMNICYVLNDEKIVCTPPAR